MNEDKYILILTEDDILNIGDALDTAVRTSWGEDRKSFEKTLIRVNENVEGEPENDQ